MSQPNLKLAEEFLMKAFKANPSYSFNNWRYMYEHSVLVKDYAVKIAKKEGADPELAGLGGLLHDIGKTYKLSAERLEREHSNYNYIISKPLFKQLSLPKARLKKLENIILYKSRSKEMYAVEDADALAFFADKKLYTVFIKWASENKKRSSAQRKIEKFHNMRFNYSKRIGKKHYDKMIKAWQPKLKKLYA